MIRDDLRSNGATMRARMFVGLLVLFAVQQVHAECGVQFRLPEKWVSHRIHIDDEKGCQLGANPRNWPQLVRNSPWTRDDHALEIFVLKTRDDAFRTAGFSYEDDPRKPTSCSRSPALPVKKSVVAGRTYYEAQGMTRGFALDD